MIVNKVTRSLSVPDIVDISPIPTIRRTHSEDTLTYTDISDIRRPLLTENNRLKNFNIQDIVDIDTARETSEPVTYTRPHTGINKKALLASVVIGIGTGLAMLPIFNQEVKELEKYGINVHGSPVLFAASTCNTLLINSISSLIEVYDILKDQTRSEHIVLTDNQKIFIKLARIGVVTTAGLPLALLWEIELQNREVEGTTGFDEFIVWAALCSIPLTISQSIKAFESVNQSIVHGEHNNISLDSIGSKLFVYTPTALAAIGRSIVYTIAVHSLCDAMGFSPEISIILSVLLGGVIGSSLVGLSEYKALKSLFKPQETVIQNKDIVVASLAVLEGSWFTMPMISIGLNATEDWNPFIKGAIFTPLFLSHMIYESSSLFDNFSTGLAENNEVSLQGDLGEIDN